jgi:hypothetical protein
MQIQLNFGGTIFEKLTDKRAGGNSESCNLQETNNLSPFSFPNVLFI